MDEKTTRLLLSSDQDERRGGMILLVNEHQERIHRYLVSRIKQLNQPFSSDDLADIWQKTVTSIWRNVESGCFRENGSLYAYTRRIAERRASDEIRRRKRRPCTEIVGDVVDDTKYNHHEVDDLLEAIRIASDELSDNLRFVLAIDVHLFLREHEWPAAKGLTIAVNKELKRRGLPELSEAAVKSRRERARRHIRMELRDRGYDV